MDPEIHVKFASDEIAKMVYDHLSSKEKDYMIKYFEIELSGPYSSLRGTIFERFVHDYIGDGQSFQVCSISSTTTVEFVCKTTYFFTNLSEVPSKKGLLLTYAGQRKNHRFSPVT